MHMSNLTPLNSITLFRGIGEPGHGISVRVHAGRAQVVGRVDDAQAIASELAANAIAAGISVRALSPMYYGADRRSGLMLGFGGFSAAQIEQAVIGLRDVIRALD